MQSGKGQGLKKKDFARFYGIQGSLAIGREAAERSSSAIQAATLAMEGESEYRGYSIKRTDDPQKILFGRFGCSEGTLSPNSYDLLTLSVDHPEVKFEKLPAVSLRYGFYPQEIVIGYIQTHADLDTFKHYAEMKRDLGARPHEFLVAQFLARIAHTLSEFPDTGVFVAQHYIDKPVYPTLRDRFFDENYSLNPNRERVRQILGENNLWLQEGAIESRRERLEELVSGREQKEKAILERLRAPSNPKSESGLGGIGAIFKSSYLERRGGWPELFV